MNARKSICIVEDNAENRAILTNALKDKFHLQVATTGEQALHAVATHPAHLILLDIIMPGIDGYEVCKRLKANPATSAIPIIFLTGVSDLAAEQLGFECGAADFISKPYSLPILMARVQHHLLLADALSDLQSQNTLLDSKVQERTLALEKTRDAIVVAMATLAETRDGDTGNHIKRTQYYVELLAKKLQTHPNFAELLSDENISLLTKSAALHDIGKVGIPDAILLKPGRLTADEFTIMKKHTTIGRNTILAAEKSLGEHNAFLRFAHEIAYSHQEKWNGSGYPLGLTGRQIPISARLMAVADVYDALRCRRVYKPAIDHKSSVAIIKKNSGSHFDPDIVNAFLAIEEIFAQVAETLTD